MLHLVRRAASLGVAASLLLAGPALAAGPNPAPTPDLAKQSTFGVQPANARGLDARPYLVYGVTPGAQIDDHVGVVNYSLHPLRLSVYATDGLNDDKGGFALKKGNERAVDAGSWLSIGTTGGTGFVTVPKRSQVIVPIHLQVPQNATPGDHVAGVLASLSTLSKDAKGLDVRLDQRVATRVYIRVSGAVRAQLTVERVHADYHDNWNPVGRGSATVTFRVRNTGNVKLGGRPRITVAGPLGLQQSGVSLPEFPLLFPGNHIDLRAEVPGVFPLFLEKAAVSVRPTLLVGDVDPGVARAYQGGTHFWAIPWTLLAILVVVTYLVRRHRKRSARGGGPRHGRTRRGPRQPSPPDGELVAADGTVMLSLSGVLAALSVLLLAPPAFAATAVPYHDPGVAGHLAFCDANGHNVTSGPLTHSAVAVKVVSDFVPPAPYSDSNGGAYLLAYQPRKGVDPGNWSGEQLTTVSSWTDRRHPSVQLLPKDISLLQASQDFPPSWDGLLQLRINYTGNNAPVLGSTYAALDVRITNGRWQAVDPVTLPCTTGTATADLVQFARAATNPPTSRPGGGTTPSRPSASAAPAAPPASAQPPVSPAQVAESQHSQGSRAGWLVGAVAVLAALGGVGTVFYKRR